MSCFQLKHTRKYLAVSIDSSLRDVMEITSSNIGSAVILPKQITKEVLEKALQEVREENQVRDMLENGVSLAKAFEEHGIL